MTCDQNIHFFVTFCVFLPRTFLFVSWSQQKKKVFKNKKNDAPNQIAFSRKEHIKISNRKIVDMNGDVLVRHESVVDRAVKTSTTPRPTLRRDDPCPEGATG